MRFTPNTRILMICGQWPYPNIKGGIERLLIDYREKVFAPAKVWNCFYRSSNNITVMNPERNKTTAKLSSQFFQNVNPDLIVVVNNDVDFLKNPLLKSELSRRPSIWAAQSLQKAGQDEAYKVYSGLILNYGSGIPDDIALKVGGFYDDSLFNTINLPAKKEHIIYSARFDPSKCQLELVKDYKNKIYQKHGIPLLLVGGTFNPSYLKSVQQYVDNKSVLWSGHTLKKTWVDGPELANLYKKARAFVLPSKAESFGLSLVEAMACGATCVVDTRFAGIKKEELQTKVYGSVSGSEGKILENLDKVLSDNIHIDGSKWVSKYAINQKRDEILAFLKRRIPALGAKIL